MLCSEEIAHKLNKKWRSRDVQLDENEFCHLMLKDEVMAGLQKCGFLKPSPVQLEAIPLGRCGLDLFIQSKSGTGKTCVFVVVALESLTGTESTQVLILAPTREVAHQIHQVITLMGCYIKNLNCKLVIGGFRVQKDESIKRSQIVVGTPGRVEQLIDMGLIKVDSIRLLVLDEADHLIKDKMHDQIKQIFHSLPKSKQTIAVSATLSEEISKLISEYMKCPVFVRLSENPSLIGVTQFYHKLGSIRTWNAKIEILFKILKNVSFSQCCIFTNCCASTKTLYDTLKKDGWPCTRIFGNLTQNERNKSMKQLKASHCRVMVATDLIARGIDCENINLVINWDFPKQYETYFHRIGRAGRFGSRGISITFLAQEDLPMFEKMQMDIKPYVVEMLPDLDKIRNLWNIFDPSANTENIFDPIRFLEGLKNPEKMKEAYCEEAFSSYRKLSEDFKENKRVFKAKNQHEIKIQLGKSYKSHFFQNLYNKNNQFLK